MIDSEHFLDFVYIGPPRSGSTWLAAALEEHPEICIPRHKEIHFFNDRAPFTMEFLYPKGMEFYKTYFKDASSHARIGDLSPMYYYDPNAAYRIHKHFPRVKILSILRDPVDMVYAFYLKRKEIEKRAKTFTLELEKTPQFLDMGFYHRLLTPYFDYFSREQIRICIFEDFFKNSRQGLASIFRYLGVDDSFVPSMVDKRVNPTKPPSSARRVWLNGLMLSSLNKPSLSWIKTLLHRMKMVRLDYGKLVEKENTPQKPPLESTLRRELCEMYKPDVKRLEMLIDRDLSFWLKP